jgi:hypothetical protein
VGKYPTASLAELKNFGDFTGRYKLPGHSNSKPTKIFTYITTKGFEQIQNPLDKLGID